MPSRFCTSVEAFGASSSSFLRDSGTMQANFFATKTEPAKPGLACGDRRVFAGPAHRRITDDPHQIELVGAHRDRDCASAKDDALRSSQVDDLTTQFRDEEIAATAVETFSKRGAGIETVPSVRRHRTNRFADAGNVRLVSIVAKCCRNGISGRNGEHRVPGGRACHAKVGMHPWFGRQDRSPPLMR